MPHQERANSGLHDHVVGQVQLLETKPHAAILDLGCGTGALLHRLKALGYSNLTGIDIAPPADVAGISFHSADLDDPRLPLPSGSIELVTAIEIVEHLENLGAVLRELRRVLATGGQMLITTPNLHSVEARVRMLATGRLKQFDEIGDPTHISPIYLFPFTRLLARHGFAVTSHWGFPQGGHSPTSRPSLRLLASLAKAMGLQGSPAGDQLCLLVKPCDTARAEAMPKATALTAHY